jgi:D-alanine-D-alanine ligase
MGNPYVRSVGNWSLARTMSLQHKVTNEAERLPQWQKLPPRRTGRIGQLQEQIDRLRRKVTVAVIFGGDKRNDGAVIFPTGNPRSWKSYEAVAQDITDSLRRLGFADVHMMPDDMTLGDRLRRSGAHIAWLNTGGVQGYHPAAHAASMLEMFGIPYVGHDPLSAATMDDKHAFKRALFSLGIPTAPFVTWNPVRESGKLVESRRFRETFMSYEGAFVVKPVNGRASQHVHMVEDAGSLEDVVREVYGKTENLVLVEAFIGGREYCVAVCGSVVAKQGRLTVNKQPFVFSAAERVLRDDERIFTSMDVRPITTGRVRLLDRTSEAAVVEPLHEIARDVFVEFGLETLIRLDIRANDAGELFVLEANPKPDLKRPSGDSLSLVCAGLAEHGMSYDDLVLSLFADRVDVLFSQRRGMVNHLLQLLD